MSLDRRTELRRTGIARGTTPLSRQSGALARRTGAGLRRTPLAVVSPRRRAEAEHRGIVWEAVLSRDHYCLLSRHPGAAGRCRGRLTPHHLQKAGQGGPFTVGNLVVLCAGHNGWVEDHPRTAHALGLVVRAGETVALAWQRLRDRGLVPA